MAMKCQEGGLKEHGKKYCAMFNQQPTVGSIIFADMSPRQL